MGVIIGNIRNQKSIQGSNDMRSIKEYIDEAMLLQRYDDEELGEVVAKSKSHLITLIQKRIDERGLDCDLNDIDVSKIKDFSFLFNHFTDDELAMFNGDISKWNVSNARNMDGMFSGSNFKGDISKWNVSKVQSMVGMFEESVFNGDISKWDVSNVETMENMFYTSDFNGDISKWDVSKVKNMAGMFADSKFDGDISKWDVSNVGNMDSMFSGSKFNGNLESWNIDDDVETSNMFTGCKMRKLPSWYKE